MIITLTGPRSIGKSTLGKVLAQQLKLRYVSSDEIGEQATKKQGGLDKAIKSGAIAQMIQTKGYSIIKRAYKKDNFVFDLSGGAFTSQRFAKASKKVRKIAQERSFVIGLLPCKNKSEAIAFLFQREKKRLHFKGMNKQELYLKTEKDYLKCRALFPKECHARVYVKGKTPKELAKEIEKMVLAQKHQ